MNDWWLEFHKSYCGGEILVKKWKEGERYKCHVCGSEYWRSRNGNE